MKNYHITFTKNGKRYSFIKAISSNLSAYAFEIAYRTAIRQYMECHGLTGDYTVVSVDELY